MSEEKGRKVLTRRNVLIGAGTFVGISLLGNLFKSDPIHPHLEATGGADVYGRNYQFKVTVRNTDHNNGHSGVLVCSVSDFGDPDKRWEAREDVKLGAGGAAFFSPWITVPAEHYEEWMSIDMEVYREGAR